MMALVNALLAEDDKGQKITLFIENCKVLKHYEGMEGTSVLETAFWKGQLKGGWSNDGTK